MTHAATMHDLSEGDRPSVPATRPSPFTPSPGSPRRVTRSLPGPLPAVLLVALLLPAVLLLCLGATTGSAQQKPPAEPLPLPAELAPLLGDDVTAQAETLSRMRADPARARAWLVQALQSRPPPPLRWRLVQRLAEFGEMDDIPLLLALWQEEGEPMEKRVIKGTLRALYGNPPAGAEFSGVVQDFSFVQTRGPVRQNNPNQGRYVVSAWSIETLHQEEVPLSLIKKVLPLRGKSFPSKDRLEEALKKQLRESEWNQNRDVLLAMVDRVPERVKLEGLARVKLFNPLDRPLLVNVALGLWFGRFEQPPPPAWLYLEPGASTGVDVPVILQAPVERAQTRMDLRLTEVNGAMIPSLHKLYLPLQF